MIDLADSRFRRFRPTLPVEPEWLEADAAATRTRSMGALGSLIAG
jgi:hypothetical protein